MSDLTHGGTTRYSARPVGSSGDERTGPGYVAATQISTFATLTHTLSDDLNRSNTWSDWQAMDGRLAGLGKLEDAVEAWRGRRDPRVYQVVAALTAIGSRRGRDDNQAALAVLVLLDDGITRLARELRDVCEVDDVRATVWEEVKLAEPNPGSRAARHLLQRARQRILRPAAGLRRRPGEVSLDARLGWGTDENTHYSVDDLEEQPPTEDPVADLIDLLTWARGTGVIREADIDLIIDLVAADHDGLAREEAQRLVGERHGVTLRTIRRRRDAAIHRLHDAVPAYLAATA